MAKNCGHTEPCGCGDTPLVTPPPCNTAPECVGEQCSELFDSNCIVYTGGDILCQGEVVVPDCVRVQQALQDIVAYFCEATTVFSNSIFIDKNYGDDTTAEYGNVAKPYKTFAAALVAANEHMKNVPLTDPLYNTSDIDSAIDSAFQLPGYNVKPFHIPRVRINVAPGVYNADEEWQYLIDNPEIFDCNNAIVEIFFGGCPEDFIGQFGFNLMFPYVDYHLQEGATLINYVWFDSGMLNAWLGDYSHEYEFTGLVTNVYGKGTLWSGRTAANAFFGSLTVDLESDAKLHIECKDINYQVYTYGGIIQIKCETYIQYIASTAEISGFSHIYLEGDDYLNAGETSPDIAVKDSSYVECDHFIQEYNGSLGSGFTAPAGAFTADGTNFKFKAKYFGGRDLEQVWTDLTQYGLPYYIPNVSGNIDFGDLSLSTGWVQNYYAHRTLGYGIQITGYSGNSYEDTSCNLVVDIEETRVLYYGMFLDVGNDANRFDADICLKYFYYRYKSFGTVGDNNFFFGLNIFGISGNSNGILKSSILFRDSNLYIEPGETFEVLFGGAKIFNINVNENNIELRNIRAKADYVFNANTNTQDPTLKDAFIEFNGFVNGTQTNVIISNCIYEALGASENTNAFAKINGASPPFEIQFIGDSYSNVPNTGGIDGLALINKIPGSNLIVNPNIKAL